MSAFQPALKLRVKRRCWLLCHYESLSVESESVLSWDPETSRERIGDWGGPETVWALLCVAERRATRPNGEWRYNPRRHMLEPERPEAV